MLQLYTFGTFLTFYVMKGSPEHHIATKPIQIYVINNCITAIHILASYHIPYDSISSCRITKLLYHIMSGISSPFSKFFKFFVNFQKKAAGCPRHFRYQKRKSLIPSSILLRFSIVILRTFALGILSSSFSIRASPCARVSGFA